MPTQVIMPALEMAQDNGKLIRWLKQEGEAVKKGEPLMEIETDKAAVEIEASADGILRDISAREGDDIPVGQPIAMIFAPDEMPHSKGLTNPLGVVTASPVAQQIAKEHALDLAKIKPRGARIEKADVLDFIARQRPSSQPSPFKGEGAKAVSSNLDVDGKLLASPRARRLAKERHINLGQVVGSGPNGAVLATDLLSASPSPSVAASELSTVWRVMAERTSASWTTVPHFFLLREVNASRMISWRTNEQSGAKTKITYTDLLVKLCATTLAAHPRVNARWSNGTIEMSRQLNIGIAVAIEDGLVVPVIQRVDQMSLKEIAARREELVERANAHKLRPEDLRDGTFTISNLGMYGVDAFNAIINAPQAAILAVGRIADRVVPLKGAPAIQPMMTLSLSCDHRVIDGARGAQFLQTLAELIENP